MTTQMHRIVCVLLVALMAGLALAGWFLVAQPQLASAADSNAQLESQQSQIGVAQTNLQHLREQKGRLDQVTARLTALQRSIPANLASSPLVAGIDQEAAAAGVLITDISVGDPTAYAPAPPATARTAAPASNGAQASPSPTPSATPTAAPGPSQSGKKTYVPPPTPRSPRATSSPFRCPSR